MEILEQEKFDTVKKLSEIQGAISDGRIELKKLEEDTEKYMVVREEQAEQRVIKVLKESREALEATTNNHKELSLYKGELQAYAVELKGLSTGISTLFQDFNKKMDIADEKMKKNYEEVQEVLKLTKVERVQVDEDRKMLGREKIALSKQRKELDSRRAAFDDAWKELDKKKN